MMRRRWYEIHPAIAWAVILITVLFAFAYFSV